MLTVTFDEGLGPKRQSMVSHIYTPWYWNFSCVILVKKKAWKLNLIQEQQRVNKIPLYYSTIFIYLYIYSTIFAFSPLLCSIIFADPTIVVFLLLFTLLNDSMKPKCCSIDKIFAACSVDDHFAISIWISLSTFNRNISYFK